MIGDIGLANRCILDGTGAKAMGAFYTDAQVADFLVWWAIRSPRDTVLDPSFGGGVFLRSACKRLLQLGGQAETQVYGVEIDPDVHRRSALKLADEFGVRAENLIWTDFFRLDPAAAADLFPLAPAAAAGVVAVVGNPPFIRYQRFTGEARKLALARSASQGVRLPELCSSWAPFLVHAGAMLRTGGRLAMVVPMELAHAAYGRPVLAYLRRAFAKVTILSFRKSLFPDLNEDTLLVLAEDKGGTPSGFLWRDLAHPGLLITLQRGGRRPLPGTRRLDGDAMAQGSERLVEHFIPRKARELYRQLRRSSQTSRLGTLADVGIGYVTGANAFFHLSPEEAQRRAVPRQFLKPAVRRGRALSGLRFTAADWQRAAGDGEAGYLLHIEEDEGSLPESVRQYLRDGVAQGVPRAYKCRTRSSWFRVPHVHRPDAFLSYMSGATPRLVANDAGAVAPSSLHVLRLHPQTGLASDAVAALWQTSLTRLSAEVEGHALGGGMLKLEPTQAENVILPWPDAAREPWLVRFAEELDAAVRGGEQAAQAQADAAILQKGLGLGRRECDLLRQAADALRGRRYSRGGPP